MFAGLKKCRPTTSCGRPVTLGERVDVERGRIAGEDRAGLGDGIELAKDVRLQVEALEDGFDDEIGRGDAVVGQRGRDAREPFVGRFRRQPSALDGGIVVLADGGKAGVERRLRRILDRHRQSRVGAGHGNAAAHRARTDNRDAGDRPRRRLRRQTADLRRGTFGEEEMNERLGLLGLDALEEQRPLTLAALVERQRSGRFDRVDNLQRRHLLAPGLRRQLACRREQRRVLVRRAQVLRPLAGLADTRGHRHVARKTNRALDEVAVDDAIDQTGGVRITGLERLSGHAHVERFPDADEARQPLRALGARNDPEVDLRLPDQGIRHGDPEVSGHGDLETAAERGAMNRHDHRLGAVFDPRQERVHVARRLAVAPRRALEAVDVGAGDERPAGAHEHDRRYRVVLLGSVEGADDGCRNAGTQRVDGRVVDGDDGDGVSYGDGYGVGHWRLDTTREVIRATRSAFFVGRGAPPPRPRVGPHPHALPALASLAPVVSNNEALGSAFSSDALRKPIQAAMSF